jgi:CheY-like chemotaxis protein/anti-sigma regulatory factor (Ser/Thr protein kinase)
VSPALWVEADPLRVEQVIVNLLSNAAKYTDAGGQIRISAEVRGAEIVLRVADNGMGIASEILPHVFESFVQGDRTLERAQGGLGIGLTLVRGLVDLHGGTVSATSGGPGRGSEFVVTLPEAPAEAAVQPPAETGEAKEAGTTTPKHRRVLVVDDNVDAARGIAAALETWGYVVQTAHDGPTAVSTARQFVPDLILLDIGLPGMDGYEVARTIKEDPRLSGTTLVALTGYGQEADRRRSRSAGFSAHLVKPVDLVTVADLLAAG